MSLNLSTTSHQPLSILGNASEPPRDGHRPSMPSLSQPGRVISARHSLKDPKKDRYYKPPPARHRVMSASEEASDDVVPDLKPIPALVNKNDKRGQDLKSHPDLNNGTPVQRRSSAPQSHLSALFPNTFRSNRFTSTQSQAGKTNVK